MWWDGRGPFVGRRGEVFARFTSQSLREYLEDDAVGDFEKSQRSEEVLAGLKRVLDMARPLVEVDERIYSDLHDGERPRLSFTFSAIPFRGLDVAEQFLEYSRTTRRSPRGCSGRWRGASTTRRCRAWMCSAPIHAPFPWRTRGC